MTNKERQNSLDKKKWLESEKENCDKSGEMNYCDYCLYQDVIYCNATQYEREQNNLCATAYNKMVRKGKKNANNN
jgi:hypothetical protein